MITLNKKNIINDLQDLIFFTKFINYEGKNNKKIEKKINKLLDHIENDDYKSCFNKKWSDKIDDTE